MRVKILPLKQWLHEEATRLSVTTGAIYDGLRAGRYPKVTIDRSKRIAGGGFNVRVVGNGHCRPPAGLPLKQWLYAQAERLGISFTAARGRYHRGKLPKVNVTRINPGRVFVQEHHRKHYSEYRKTV